MLHKNPPQSFTEVHRRYHHFATEVLWALIVMAVVLAASLGAQAYLISKYNSESKRRADQFREEAEARTAAIQQSRIKLLRETCEQTTKRNRDTKRRLRLFAARNTQLTSAQRRQQIQGAEQLIDALAPPVRNCAANARKRITASTPKPQDADAPQAIRSPRHSTQIAIAGPRGPRGPRGPVASRGQPGPKGQRGLRGPPGPMGDTGPVGPAGPKGDTGLQGAQGDTGSRGPKGDTGTPGPMGPQGPPGSFVPCQMLDPALGYQCALLPPPAPPLPPPA